MARSGRAVTGPAPTEQDRMSGAAYPHNVSADCQAGSPDRCAECAGCAHYCHPRQVVP